MFYNIKHVNRNEKAIAMKACKFIKFDRQEIKETASYALSNTK